MPEPPPPKTRIGRILRDHPEARGRLGRTVFSLAVTVGVALTALVLLLLWHARRRVDIIRSHLGEARGGSLDDLSPRRSPTDKDGSA